MPPTTVGIDPRELREAIASLVTLSQPVDFRDLANDLFLVAQADVDERFSSAPAVRSDGIVFGGVMWPALTDPYLRRNPRREGGQQLRDEGELLNSFQIGGTGNIAESSQDEAIFGSALPKARGLNRKRPMLFIHDELADNTLNTIADRIAIAEGL